MGGEYTPMILSPQWIISFEKNIWNIIWNSCWVGFFPVSTKMKAQWACANIRWVKILYYFISLCKNPWWVYGLLIIFSTSGFPVIIKFQPATCNLQPAKNTCRITYLFVMTVICWLTSTCTTRFITKLVFPRETINNKICSLARSHTAFLPNFLFFPFFDHITLRSKWKHTMATPILHQYTFYLYYPGGLRGSIFAGYVPLASPNPYPIIVYSVANHRPYLSHFWANVIFAIPT